MPNIYHPDKFVVIELNSEQHGKIRKVLGSWYGGYAGADNWRVSSGITETFIRDGVIEFRNESGSVYYCHWSTEGMSMHTQSVYNNWLKKASESNGFYSIRLVPMEEYFPEETFDCY